MRRSSRDGLKRSRALRLLAPLLACGLLAVLPSLASAGDTDLLGASPLVEGIGFCNLEASGALGAQRSESALQYAADDGTIKKWFFIGSASGKATVSLDIFEPGSATHPVIERQFVSPYDEFGDATVTVTQTIPVSAGQTFGVTVSASADSDPETEANAAAVQCTGGSAQSLLKIWEAPLTIGQSIVPNKEGPGELAIGGSSFEYDAPVVESVSPEAGPAAGGQEVTITGKHLANARVYFPEGAIKVAGQTSAGEDTEVKVITPEAVTSGPIEGSLQTAAPGSVRFKYTYIGTPRSRTPEIVLEPVTNITETSAQLHASVNIEGLVANESGPPGCAFGYGAHEIEEESVVCEPFPEPGSETTQDVSTQLYELSPGTTYHYFLDVNTKYAERSGHAETNDEASFKTLGVGEKGEVEKTKEAEKASPAKELSATIPAPMTPQPIIPSKSLVATIPAVGLVGGSSLTATTAGVLPIKVSCPVGESTCIGSITLKTIGAVSASAAHEAKKAVLTLATGSFKVPGGETASVRLHLSAKARALLKRSHTLHARATIVAHDSSGATHTTVATLTVRAAKSKRQ